MSTQHNSVFHLEIVFLNVILSLAEADIVSACVPGAIFILIVELRAASCSRSSTGTTSQYNKMKIAQSHRPRWLLGDKQNWNTVLQMSLGMLLCHESY